GVIPCDIFLGQKLIDRRSPQVAVFEVAGGQGRRVIVGEPQHDLVAVVDVRQRAVDAVVPCIDRLANPAVEGVVRILGDISGGVRQ
ncbi:MAG: hypothetical protein IT427_04875, partial [Pirellulales bacterium]|nr:hypothetical protein [Pirellulales bacterium]